MLYILHIPNLDPPNFGAWGMVYILHMPHLDPQNLEIGHVVYCTRHQNILEFGHQNFCA